MGKNFKFYRIYYSLLATLIITSLLYLNFSMRSILLWRPMAVEKIFSGIMLVAGLAVMFVCIRKYFFDLSGISVFFHRHAPPEKLQVNGLNKYVRHPLYSGTLFFAWSFFLWEPLLSNFLSCLCILIYTLMGIRYEERKLLKTFGDDYKNYAAKVPMLFVKIL
jgi:protein-S-isoprenylcysteine O-methyltransferase Ste14